MKKALIGLILVTLMLSFACTKNPSQPSVIQWRAHTTEAAGSAEANFLQKIADEVKAKSNGQLVITVYPGGSLGYTDQDILRVMKQDVLELAHTYPTSIATDEPLADVGQLPFLAGSPDDVFKLVTALQPLYEEILTEWHATKLGGWSSSLATLSAVRKVDTVDKWKGLKVRAWSATLSDVIAALGATPVSVPSSEVYSATAAKILEAHIYSPASIWDKKLFEVVPYIGTWDVAASSSILLANTTAMGKLPKNLQDIVIKAVENNNQTVWDEEFWSYKDFIAKLKSEKNVEVFEVAPAEKQKAAAIIAPVYDKWLKNAGADGLKWLNISLQALGKPAYK